MANNNLTGDQLENKEKVSNTYFEKVAPFEVKKSESIYEGQSQSYGSQMKGKGKPSLSRTAQLKGNGINEYSRYY